MVVVGGTTKGFAQSDGQGGNVDVKEALVRPVGWGARPERGWAGAEAPAVTFEIGFVVDVAEVAFAVADVRNDFARSTGADRGFADSVVFGGAVDLDDDPNEIAGLPEVKGTGGVGAVSGEKAAILGEVAEDFRGKGGLSVA